MHSYLIPVAGVVLYPFIENVMPIITANTAAWNIPTSAVSDLQDSVTPFTQAWLIFITPNSGKVDRNNMNVAREAARLVMAAFARAYLLYNPLVSAAILTQMGFGPKPTPIPGWSTAPILSLRHTTRQVKIRFKGTETARQGKAIGAQCIEVCTKFSVTKPANVDDYTAMRQATKSPLVITCTEEQLGSCMWFWARWVGSNASHEGAWSSMYSTYFT
ncbi:hypothetical protein FACS1894200_12750 [Spirochaetia bacterium]|nr:hypothetical protein FACS1894200_12750 [Spirochaetia bacterium]